MCGAEVREECANPCRRSPHVTRRRLQLGRFPAQLDDLVVGGAESPLPDLQHRLQVCQGFRRVTERGVADRDLQPPVQDVRVVGGPLGSDLGDEEFVLPEGTGVVAAEQQGVRELEADASALSAWGIDRAGVS